MGHLRRSLMVGAILAVVPAAAASAADFPTYKDVPPFPPSIKDVPPPAPIPSHKDWYFRGFLGMSNQHAKTFTHVNMKEAEYTIEQKGFDSAPFFGLGIGYAHSPWLRFDVTGEYRGKAAFRGLDHFVDHDEKCAFIHDGEPGVCPTAHTGSKSEWLFLANAYFDLGEWKGFTPYVGAGIGTANVKTHDFLAVGTPHDSVWWAKGKGEWNLAWALHAGVAYDVTPAFTVDLAYRYVDMGDAKTQGYFTFDPIHEQNITPLTIKDVTSHDLMLGVRWRFGEVFAPPPFKY